MKIAIVKLSAMGDIVHAMFALQFIHAHFPEAQIDWVVEEQFAGLLKHNPHINQILTVNIKNLKEETTGLFKEIAKLREYAKANYDLVIDAQGLIKSAIVAKLLGKKVIGFDKNSIRESSASYLYNQKVNCPYTENTIDRNAKVIAEGLGFSITPEEIRAKNPFLYFKTKDLRIFNLLRNDRKNIVFVIGSTWESRNYPPEKFMVIADSLQQNCLVIWATAKEKVIADSMAQQSEYVQMVHRLDLNSLKALIGQCDLVIGNDTGPTHIAWGLNKPSITIFGPTPVSRVYETEINKVIKSDSIVNPLKLNKQDFSIRDIDPQPIIEMAEILLGL